MLLDFSSDFRRLIFTPKWLPTPRNIQTTLAIRRLNKIVFRMIAERRASGRDAGDLLSMLLAARDEDGSRMDDKQLRDETLTLFLAGYETTANLLAWTWWLLATHPEAEHKLHQELDGLLAGRSPAMDDLPRLRYAGHILTESLRLYPPAWGMARLAIEDHEIAGYPVPAGTGVAIAQWVVQRDPRWYEAPEEFRPERWEGDLQKKLPRFAYFPFGGGPRQCIGNMFALMEATLVLATVAQHFRLRMMPDQEVVPLASITLRPKNGVAMRLEARRRAKYDLNIPAAAVNGI
jgi:cytochrome P450